MKLVFRKTGREIKAAIQHRITQLEQRLARRNQLLDDLLDDKRRLRSYLIRSSQMVTGHGRDPSYFLPSKHDISSEEQLEINQLCRRIYEVEQEMRRLQLIASHLDDNEVHELELRDLVAYGFEIEG